MPISKQQRPTLAGPATLLSIIVLHFSLCFGQHLPDYYQRSSLLLAPPASFSNGMVGFSNPAVLTVVTQPEMRLMWRSDPEKAASFQDGGISFGLPRFGVSFVRSETGAGRRDDYKISFAGGTPGAAIGLGYGWTSSNKADQILTAGLILRPNSRISFGAVGNFSLEHNQREGIVELGLRPLAADWITLFTDAAMQKDDLLSDIKWSAGAILTPVSGLSLVGRFFENESFSLGITANFGRSGLSARSDFSSDHGFARSSYGIRLGGMKPRLFQETYGRGSRYVEIDLGGRIDYLKYRFLDANTKTFYQILRNIEAAAKDPRVKLIIITLSGMRAIPEHAWEIRESLKAAKSAGKRVLAFIDKAHMSSYHLASVADWVILDPQGNISLPGYAVSKTYLSGTLDKLGLGFDEWRFFEYKSAAEILSREAMSDADREQNTAYLDDRYEVVRGEICESRHLTEDQFDAIVNNDVFVLPSEAIDKGLVDKIGRKSSISELIPTLTGRSLTELSAEELYDNALREDTWGKPARIALVYALGVCAMDNGIRARWLEKILLGLASNNDVKAVVFRVDSPGGEGLASDLVAQALRECARKKPVIVSQGQVAGSGGYWISMYGDKIVAAPMTITGSIGVIGGWLYDNGFSSHLGLTSDLIKRGAHADLWHGVRLPYLGTIPARNLDSVEKERMKAIVFAFYDDFVNKVSQSRNLPVETVRNIAEGRIYSGQDGKALGLVDVIGGLMTAIKIAKASLPPDIAAEAEVIEIPEFKGLVDFGLPSLPVRSETTVDPVLDFIKILSENQGEPMFLLYPGTYPDYP